MRLFDPISWILIFLSILFVSIFFFFSARIGTSYFGTQTFNQEIILSPFRHILDLKLTPTKRKISRLHNTYVENVLNEYSRSVILRVPLLNHQHKSFGISSKMIFLLWCVCGGFLLFFLECNFLTILVKPNYEKPVDTAKDVLDRGLTVVWYPYYEEWREMLLNQNLSQVTKDLAENTYVSKVSYTYMYFTKLIFISKPFNYYIKISKDWDDYEEKVKDWVIGSGSSVVEASVLGTYSELTFGRWHRSKGRKDYGSTPYGYYMLNKKWTLQEEFTNHMLRFQQVTASSIYFRKLHFNIPGWIDCH